MKVLSIYYKCFMERSSVLIPRNVEWDRGEKAVFNNPSWEGMGHNVGRGGKNTSRPKKQTRGGKGECGVFFERGKNIPDSSE